MGEHDAGSEDSQSKGLLFRTMERQLWKPEQVTLVPCLGHAMVFKAWEEETISFAFQKGRRGIGL